MGTVEHRAVCHHSGGRRCPSDDQQLPRDLKVLLASNLDSRAPFGNFTRPFFLGRALAELGVEVANVSIDPSAIDFGPTARATPKPLARMAADIARAARRFGPDVIYAHEMRPALASLLVRSGVPVVADFHSLPSI